MSYQGHLPDGSSVQKHSAGSCYPFVVYGQETPDGLKFGVIGPRHTTGPKWSCAEACEKADLAAEVWRKMQARAPATAKVYVAATDSVVEVDLNANLGRLTQPRYPDAWGVV